MNKEFESILLGIINNKEFGKEIFLPKNLPRLKSVLSDIASDHNLEKNILLNILSNTTLMESLLNSSDDSIYLIGSTFVSKMTDVFGYKEEISYNFVSMMSRVLIGKDIEFNKVLSLNNDSDDYFTVNQPSNLNQKASPSGRFKIPVLKNKKILGVIFAAVIVVFATPVKNFIMNISQQEDQIQDETNKAVNDNTLSNSILSQVDEAAEKDEKIVEKNEEELSREIPQKMSEQITDDIEKILSESKKELDDLKAQMKAFLEKQEIWREGEKAAWNELREIRIEDREDLAGRINQLEREIEGQSWDLNRINDGAYELSGDVWLSKLKELYQDITGKVWEYEPGESSELSSHSREIGNQNLDAKLSIQEQKVIAQDFARASTSSEPQNGFVSWKPDMIRG